MSNVHIQKLLYPELSYQIVGILFRVQNELGKGYQEKHIQRAVADELIRAEIPFREQVMVTLEFKEKIVGRYFLDFIVSDKIVVELKVCERPLRKDFDQIKQYLYKSGLELGLLACFGRNGVKVYRVVRPSK